MQKEYWELKLGMEATDRVWRVCLPFTALPVWSYSWTYLLPQEVENNLDLPPQICRFCIKLFWEIKYKIILKANWETTDSEKKVLCYSCMCLKIGHKFPRKEGSFIQQKGKNSRTRMEVTARTFTNLTTGCIFLCVRPSRFLQIYHP